MYAAKTSSIYENHRRVLCTLSLPRWGFIGDYSSSDTWQLKCPFVPGGVRFEDLMNDPAPVEFSSWDKHNASPSLSKTSRLSFNLCRPTPSHRVIIQLHCQERQLRAPEWRFVKSETNDSHSGLMHTLCKHISKYKIHVHNMYTASVLLMDS